MRLDQHLRLRPAHGPRPHHRPGRADAGPRDHRRGRREGFSDVQFLDIGDIVSVPFNVACGALPPLLQVAGYRRVPDGEPFACRSGAYGYVDMGGWIGRTGRDTSPSPMPTSTCSNFPTATGRCRRYATSPCSPTSCRPVSTVRRRPASGGSTVYVAGAGPVGLAAASARMLGAAVVMIGDLNTDRLGTPKSSVSHPSTSKGRPSWRTRSPNRRHQRGRQRHRRRGFRSSARAIPVANNPAIVLNQMMEITRAAGSIGIPGLYVTEPSGAVDAAGKTGQPVAALRPRLGKGAVTSIPARRRC